MEKKQLEISHTGIEKTSTGQSLEDSPVNLNSRCLSWVRRGTVLVFLTSGHRLPVTAYTYNEKNINRKELLSGGGISETHNPIPLARLPPRQSTCHWPGLGGDPMRSSEHCGFPVCSLRGYKWISPKDMPYEALSAVTLCPRSHDVKNGGEITHSTHSPGQSSPRPVISQRVVNNKQAASGFIGPQLPSHMIKVTFQRLDVISVVTWVLFEASG